MESVNPYSPPTAGVSDVVLSSKETERLNRIASNQRVVIYAVAVSLLTNPLRAVIGDAGLLLSFIAGLAALIGAIRLASALGFAMWLRVVYAIFMIIPLINLLAMLSLSSRTTKQLRAGGYRVGLFGAKPRKA
jgi:hypothetical protein